MKKRLLSKSDCYSDGLIVIGDKNLAVGKNTHVELNDEGIIVGMCIAEKEKPKTTRKPTVKKETK